MWKPQKMMSNIAILTWERSINPASWTPEREITLAYLKEKQLREITLAYLKEKQLRRKLGTHYSKGWSWQQTDKQTGQKNKPWIDKDKDNMPRSIDVGA